MEPDTFDESVQEETAQAKNFFTRLGGVFSSPREAFTEIGRAPNMVIPIIALVLISAFGVWYTWQKIDTQAVLRATMEQAVKRGQIPESAPVPERDQQMEMFMASTGPVLIILGGVSALIICLAIAGYGKLFSMIAGAENSYKSLFEVSTYAMLAVSVVSTILMVIILQIKGQGRIETADINSIVASNLGSWIESAAGTDVLPKFIMGLARAVDIFNIWIIALLSIGFSAVSKKLKTSTAAMWLGGVYVIFSVIKAAISTAVGG